MSISIGIPAISSQIEIRNFSLEVARVLQSIFPDTICAFSELYFVSENLSNDNLLVKKSTKLRFLQQNSEVVIFYDDVESSFEYNNEHFSTTWFYMDNTGFRSHLGYLAMAVFSILIAEKQLNLIEDPSNFWTPAEILSTSNFLNQIQVLEAPLHGTTNQLAKLFHDNLNHNSSTNAF